MGDDTARPTTNDAPSGRLHLLRAPPARAALAGALAWAAWGALTGAGLPEGTARMGAVAGLMATLWVTEALPIPVTSLLPLVLFPALGIDTFASTSSAYGKPVIFLFLGGFLLALGLQRSMLHRRVALAIVHAIGSEPRRLVLGFMVATGSISMWISNTASVMVMLPIALALLAEARGHDVSTQNLGPVGTALMLSISYAASIGGMATLVGTPANLVFAELQEKLVPPTDQISFAQWMAFGVPLTLLFLGLGWYLLAFRIFPLTREPIFGEGDAVAVARAGLGAVSRDEWVAGTCFIAAALLWVTGADLPMGNATVVPGWRSALGLEDVGDGAVAIVCALPLFLVPSSTHRGEGIMTWEATQSVPWGVLLLFGGGFALAEGFETSGLSGVVGASFTGLAGAPTLLAVAVVCTVITFLTELTSNTAIVTLVLPILAEAAVRLGMDPLVLMIPATLSASCAFMMPVGSPTQAIVYGSGYIPIGQMVRAGFWFNVLGVVLMTALLYLIGGPTLGIPIGPFR